MPTDVVTARTGNEPPASRVRIPRGPHRRLASVVRRLTTPQALIIGACVGVVGFLVLAPLYFLFHNAFVGDDGFTTDGFARAYGPNSPAGEMMINSVLFAGGSTILALIVGTALAYAVVRTDAPFKALLFAAAIGPLVIPGVLYTISWIFLADPQIGALNSLIFTPLFGDPVVDVYSLRGMIWVQGLHDMPIAFLFMVAAFRAMDPSLEESAASCGARWSTILRRITIPLLRPATAAAALLVFLKALEAFEVPAMIGMRSGIFVLTSRIYFELRTIPVDYTAAGAYAVTLLLIAVVGLLISRWLSRNARAYQTVSGKGFRARPIGLGRARPFVAAGIVIYVTIAIVLPLAMLVYGSLLPYYQAPSLAGLKSLSLETYQDVLQMPEALRAFRNSFMLAVAAATIVMVLTSITAWVTVRSRSRGARVLDVLTLTPLTVPGLVLALALAFLYLRIPLPIYATLWILLISYCTQAIPYGQRYASAGISQMSNELEEAAQVSGASWWMTIRRILVPIASNGILAGWIYIVIVMIRELATSIILYSSGGEVLSVMIFEEYDAGRLNNVAAIGVMMISLLLALVLVAYRFGARVGLDREAT